MKKYICDVCGYEYDPAVGDPDNGIQPGTPFEDLPADWVCPLRQLGKDEFSPEDEKYTQPPPGIRPFSLAALSAMA